VLSAFATDTSLVLAPMDIEPRGSPDIEPRGSPDIEPRGSPDIEPRGSPDIEPRGSPDIAEKSNEIPAAQTLLAELGLAPGAIVTLDALHCPKNSSPSR